MWNGKCSRKCLLANKSAEPHQPANQNAARGDVEWEVVERVPVSTFDCYLETRIYYILLAFLNKRVLQIVFPRASPTNQPIRTHTCNKQPIRSQTCNNQPIRAQLDSSEPIIEWVTETTDQWEERNEVLCQAHYYSRKLAEPFAMVCTINDIMC